MNYPAPAPTSWVPARCRRCGAPIEYSRHFGDWVDSPTYTSWCDLTRLHPNVAAAVKKHGRQVHEPAQTTEVSR